jgi:hypothetical protein
MQHALLCASIIKWNNYIMPGGEGCDQFSLEIVILIYFIARFFCYASVMLTDAQTQPCSDARFS